jgi:DNA-binding response OmpR family regulator
MTKVLIVEDNVLIADLLEDYLVYGGYEVCGIAGSVSEAVKMADLHKPDIGVLDFRLGNGALGSQIRPLLADETSMKVLYVSADDLHDMLTDKDGDACLRKPYGIDDLLSAVRIVCALKTNAKSSPIQYPNNFRLLREEAPLDQEVA